MRIGIRLGGTQAHGALLAGGRVRAAGTARLGGAPHRALSGLLRQLAGEAAGRIHSVTWDVSALLDGALYPPVRRVAALRLQPRPARTCSLADHPSSLVRSLVNWRGHATGGHDLFGGELAELDIPAVLRLVEPFGTVEDAAPGSAAVLAVTATGAVSCADHERAVAERVLGRCPRLRVCLSHEVGGIGLLEREAATVLNAALLGAAEQIAGRCVRATDALPGPPSCWFTTGDGGRMSPERLRSLPVLGIGSERAAGLLGAAILSEQPNALIMVTGTDTAVVGRVHDGLPQVAADLPGPSGVRLAAPQAVLTTTAAGMAPEMVAAYVEHDPGAAVVLAVAAGAANGHGDARALADRLGADTGRRAVLLDGAADPGAVGAAGAEPSAWLDLMINAVTPEELRRQLAEAEQRALTMVAAGGAQPGRERIVESVAYSLPFIRSGTYRLHVRASGAPGQGEDG
ncbi:hydantoinase/oxoprolinase family protein [Amycolatopsis aidingensis]|uniref:hypothetical protein n=1 Tax=Amycolatopsis aidingensis TaxID=2842453 RepID=UPI001C0AAB21|nr:hypothetical protein [Amycolatopsis aidingensis]